MSPRPPHRFYFPGRLESGDGETIELSAEESHHLLRVLRLRPGAPVDLFDMEGRAFRAELTGQAGNLALVRVIEQILENKLSGPSVNIAVSVIKRRPMDWMIEKLSELGVERLQPLLATRSIGQGDFQAGETPQRWDRLALAAAKQCGRNRPLIVAAPVRVNAWLAGLDAAAWRMVAHPAPDAVPIGQAPGRRTHPDQPLWTAIGPEGGWTAAEAESFVAAGFLPVSLGELILRAETAAIAAAAVCRLI